MTVWFGLAAGALSGCFIKPDPPGNNQSGSDAALVDVAITDAPTDSLRVTTDAATDAPPCLIRDNFDTNGAGCGAWAGTAVPTGGVTIDRTGGELNIGTPQTAGTGVCIARMKSDFTNGIIVKITTMSNELGATGGIRVVLDDNSTFFELELAGQGSNANAPFVRINKASGPTQFVGDWDPSGQAYWWLHPSGGEIYFSYSSSQMGTYTDLYHTPVSSTSVLANATVSLFGDFGTEQNVRQQITFDDLDGCR